MPFVVLEGVVGYTTQRTCMRIAICTSPLSSGHKLRGIGTYTTGLIDALKRNTSKHRYTFFSKKSEIPKDADIIHYPFFDPFFLTLPVSLPAPTVVTVHDLVPVLFPKYFPRGIRGEVKWQIQRRALMNVSHIIADSNTSKNDIIQIVGFPNERISVIPLAPSGSMKPVTDPQILSNVMETYDLPHEFALYVGDVNWNKNVIGLLTAWREIVMHRMLAHDTKLVLVGAAFIDKNLFEAQKINTLLKKYAIEDSVMRVGFVPEKDLRALYMLAGACIVPSLYEGFGLPILEAMACGGVVVSSDTASLKEIAGPAIIVDPENSTDIARGIVSASKLTTAKRERLIEQGIAWAGKFTWSNVATQTISVYERLASES